MFNKTKNGVDSIQLYDDIDNIIDKKYIIKINDNYLDTDALRQFNTKIIQSILGCHKNIVHIQQKF